MFIKSIMPFPPLSSDYLCPFRIQEDYQPGKMGLFGNKSPGKKIPVGTPSW